ncbi:MAG: PAS domain-containing protein [Actinomycetota bacterium]
MTDPTPFDATEFVALFFDLFESSSDAVFMITVPDGHIMDVNDAALRLFGMTRSATFDKTTLELGMWADPTDRETWLAEIEEEGRVKRFPARFRTRSGEEFTMVLSGTLARYRGERVILSVGTVVGDH